MSSKGLEVDGMQTHDLIAQLWSLILLQRLVILRKVVLEEVDKPIVRFLRSTRVFNDQSSSQDNRCCGFRCFCLGRRRGGIG